MVLLHCINKNTMSIFMNGDKNISDSCEGIRNNFTIRNGLRNSGIFCSIGMIIIAFATFHYHNEDTPLEIAMESSLVTRIAFNSPILICLPLLIDLALDRYFNSRHGIFLRERLMLLGGFLLPSLFYLLFANSNHGLQRRAYFVGTLYQAQLPFNAGIIYSLATTSTIKNKHLFGSLFWALIALTVGGTLGLIRTAFPNNVPLSVGYWICTICCFAGNGIFIFRYFRSFSSLEIIPVEEILPFGMTLLLFLFGIILLYPIVLGRFSFIEYNTNTLVIMNSLLGLLYVFAILLPGRCSRNLMQETQRTIDSKRAFIRYISHEIRTPANICGVGMGLVSEQLNELGVFVGEVKETMSQVQDSMFSISELLNNLLEFENVDGNVLDVNPVEVNPLTFVRQSVRILEMQAKQNGIEFSVVTPNEMDNAVEFKIEIDVFKMGQALRNFVSNAIRFTPIGGKIAIMLKPFYVPYNTSVSTKNRDKCDYESWIRISVSDTGEGMTQTMLDKLQNEGDQFDHNCLEPGQASGLSLFISKSIVHKHGGRIVVTSKGLGLGSVFSIELPLKSGASMLTANSYIRLSSKECSHSSYGGFFPSPRNLVSMALEACSPSPRSKVVPVSAELDLFDLEQGINLRSDTNETPVNVREHVSTVLQNDSDGVLVTVANTCTSAVDSGEKPCMLSGIRILCVDDSVVNLKMVTMLMNRLGGTCEQALNGQIAVAMVKASMAASNAYDFVVMDNFMPEMCGPEACELMRETGYSNPIFGLTGHVLAVDIQEYMHAGANHVFKKPLNFSEFRDVAFANHISMPIANRSMVAINNANESLPADSVLAQSKSSLQSYAYSDLDI